uniref:rRNA adenine N(6)-methyltransferase n=1 Tax=Oryza glumipatula TaxID=40148 RepID=A0A0E0AA06_9ORYZ
MAGGKIQKKRHGGGGGGGGGGGDGARLQGGISFDKSKGQHILRNPALVDSIVEKAGLKPTDTVLEIGPARGTSPSAFLQAGVKAVVATPHVYNSVSCFFVLTYMGDHQHWTPMAERQSLLVRPEQAKPSRRHWLELMELFWSDPPTV